jgi:hypothetical protein
MHTVDDATTKALGWFSADESIWAAVAVLRRWIERYGVSASAVHGLEERLRAPAQCRGVHARRASGDAVWAHVRQAGPCHHSRQFAASQRRVERAHSTHQDRLVKKSRLAGIANYEQANAYLDQHYLADHNRRYAHAAAAPADYHRRRPTTRQLDEVFWLEEERVISEDWVVRYQNQLPQNGPAGPGHLRRVAWWCGRTKPGK